MCTIFRVLEALTGCRAASSTRRPERLLLAADCRRQQRRSLLIGQRRMNFHAHYVTPLQHPLLNLYDIIGFCDAKAPRTPNGMPAPQHLDA